MLADGPTFEMFFLQNEAKFMTCVCERLLQHLGGCISAHPNLNFVPGTVVEVVQLVSRMNANMHI
jgi:hypothetical protein